jgi:hypothetical protein
VGRKPGATFEFLSGRRPRPGEKIATRARAERTVGVKGSGRSSRWNRGSWRAGLAMAAAPALVSCGLDDRTFHGATFQAPANGGGPAIPGAAGVGQNTDDASSRQGLEPLDGEQGMPPPALPGTPSEAEPRGEPSVAASLTADVQSLEFGTAVLGQSVPAALTLTNGAEAPVSIALTVTGDGAPDFEVLANGCAVELGAKSSCTLSLQLTPSSAGPRLAELTVSSSDGMSITVALSGQGLEPGTLTSDTSGFDFGGREVGLQCPVRALPTRSANPRDRRAWPAAWP